jgi:diacylglycerol O-acyltransferase
MLLALGTRLSSRALARFGTRNVNTVTTNVPGPQFPLFAVGRRMIEAFPYVPLAAPVRVGIAIFSYSGNLTFGVTGDFDTAPDVDVLCRGIEDEMLELQKLVGA